MCLCQVAPEEVYEVQRVVEEAALQVVHESHTVVVTLTAPVMREQLLLHTADTPGTAGAAAGILICSAQRLGRGGTWDTAMQLLSTSFLPSIYSSLYLSI